MLHQNRYEIKEVLSDKGGMGLTFKGTDNNLSREVVIKTLRPEHIQDPEEAKKFWSLFRDEAIYQARLNYPYIAQIYDYYEENEAGFIVLEYAEGKSLDNFSELFNPSKENLDETLLVIEQIIKGVIYAHEKGIIHRDLKPENILYDKQKKLVKIIDFGLAKIKEAIPRPHTVYQWGTKGYFAPERYEGLDQIGITFDTEEKTDYYSLGVIFFELLTGLKPYMEIKEVLSKEIRRISSFRNDINTELDELIFSLMQIKPHERLGSLESLLNAVRKHIKLGYKPGVLINRIRDNNQLRDPIHGYINFSDEEKLVINHPVFQRLRRIKQLSTTYLTYPGATHDRFAHSMGVMHVGTKIFDEVIRKNSNSLEWDNEEVNKQRQMLRLASLLHDIGHAPFSHVGDGLFPTSIPNHERMAEYLIKQTELKDIIDRIGSQNGGFSHKEIAGLIVGNYKSSYRLIREIFSSQLDADKMDYLLRDSRMTGVNYGNFDMGHLIRSINIDYQLDNDPILGVDKSGVHALEGLILARYFMFTQVYFHRTRRIYDKILEKIMYNILPSNQIPSDINDFLKWDDHKVFEVIKNDQTSLWNKMFYTRNHPKLLFELFPHVNDEDKKFAEHIKSVLTQKGFNDNELIIDNIQHPPIRFSDEEGNPLIRILEKNGVANSVNKYSSILSSLNDPIYIFRVYAGEGIMADVKKIIEEETKHV
ncbi:protein kinase domain-containing protein [Bacillus salacetis]|nr:protein kinase [Bacillus salacetis]